MNVSGITRYANFKTMSESITDWQKFYAKSYLLRGNPGI